MLKLVNEGLLDSFVKSNEVLTAGQLVKLNGEGIITVASAGNAIHGVVSTDVISANVDNYKLDNVVLKARIGTKVGVFIQGGVYLTDQFTGTVTAGNPLYVAALGKLTATSGGASVAIAENTVDASVAGSLLRFKLTI
jgi:hypothetical protein